MPLPLEEFLEKLTKSEAKWYLDQTCQPTNAIRSRENGLLHCPYTQLLQPPMKQEVAKQIWDSADNQRSSPYFSVTLRKQLLEACKLQEAPL